MKNRIKKSYICRDIFDFSVLNNAEILYRKPQIGDVGLFEVMSIGKHKTIQGHEKRNMSILPGDTIMAAFGTRYATEQFEGYPPEHCDQELHILGAGGTVGVVESMHAKFMNVGPTRLRFLGYTMDNYSGEIKNTKAFYEKELLRFSPNYASMGNIILSVGSSMDSGKTTSAAYLCRGLKKAGFRVAFIKLTGTVYTKDCDLNVDLGADIAVDFSNLGYPSTYLCEEEELLDLYATLVNKVSVVKPDYIVMEIADGLYQRETRMLLRNRRLMDTVAAVMFSAGDSLAAINGVNILNSWGIHPFAVSGLLTASPLLVKEVKENLSLPVVTIAELMDEAAEIMRNASFSHLPCLQIAKAS